MNNLAAEKDMSQDHWFAEATMIVSIGKHKKQVVCRASHFAVTETKNSYQVEIFGLEIVGLVKADYEKIPKVSQGLIKARLIQNITAKLELVRRMSPSPDTPPPTASVA